ncbi:MAG: ABC transporter ATP-binding protein [Phycisphaerae bacterium]|nr:ABC transporter ATP-binding protein [Phycisphaerae bacterium]MCZ2398522.1 ABC transporter ATP-binding protein [Phycisphaerae bacterium]NUQ50343.1 ABC transporter ATP-binding protein [Phycisphaerae bacterium]
MAVPQQPNETAADVAFGVARDAPPALIVADQLSKAFPNPDGTRKLAVRQLSLSVAPGEIYGLLGPNGAGKTTTLRMISGLLQPTEGRVLIDGQDVARFPLAVKRKIGYLTANTGLYARLTPRELLDYFGTLYGMAREARRRRIGELAEYLGMGDFLGLRCGALSTGQRQRTNIARALIADPPVLILDEPTLGLDVLSNRLILRLIQSQAQQGKAVLLSTHALDEIEVLCRRVGLIHRGALLAEGDLDALRQRTGRTRLSEVFLHLVGADEPLLAH